MEYLSECRIAVFGIGGVGGYVCEALARSHCICPPGAKRHCTDRRDIPGSTAFVPSAAGLIIAGEVIQDLTKRTN